MLCAYWRRPLQGLCYTRCLRLSSSVGDGSSSSSSSSWRRQQLDQIENKFTDTEPKQYAVNRDDDLQPEWRALESRVIKRRTLTPEQRGGKIGRSNIRRGEEDVWLENGLYDNKEESTSR
jgi:hypothetical protein